MPKTLGQLIDGYGFGHAQTKTLIGGGGVWLADGSELLLIGAVSKVVADTWNLDAFERGSIVSIVFIGVFLGNMFSGILGDTMGRRFPVLLSYAMVFICSLISAGAWNYNMLAASRLLVGVAFGVGQPAMNTLSTELSPTSSRLVMMAAGGIMFSLGELYSAILIAVDDIQMQELNWRWLIAVGALPSLVLGIYAYYALYESPRWLAANDRKDEAIEVLKDVRDLNKDSADKAFYTSIPDQYDLDGDGSRSPIRVKRDFSQKDSELDFVDDDEEDKQKLLPKDGKGKSGKSSTSSSSHVHQSDAELTSFQRLQITFSRRHIVPSLFLVYTAFVLNFIFYGGLYGFPQVLSSMGDTLALAPALNLAFAAVFSVLGQVLGLYVGSRLQRRPALILYLASCSVATLCFLAGASLSPVAVEDARKNRGGNIDLKTATNTTEAIIIVGKKDKNENAELKKAAGITDEKHEKVSEKLEVLKSANEAQEKVHEIKKKAEADVVDELTTPKTAVEETHAAENTEVSEKSSSSSQPKKPSAVAKSFLQISSNEIDSSLLETETEEEKHKHEEELRHKHKQHENFWNYKTLGNYFEYYPLMMGYTQALPIISWDWHKEEDDLIKFHQMQKDELMGNTKLSAKSHKKKDELLKGSNSLNANESENLKNNSAESATFDLEILLHLGIFLNKICVGLGFMITYLYSLEVYPTTCRVTGNALTLASGRIGSILCPMIYEYLAIDNPLYFFVLMIVFMLINLLMVIFLPLPETAGKPLMEHGEDLTVCDDEPYYRSFMIKRD